MEGADGTDELGQRRLDLPEPAPPPRPGPGPAGPSQGLALLLAQLGAHSSRSFADAVAAIGLSATDASVLQLVAFAPGLSQREVADRLGLQPSRLVALVDALEAHGLVERTRNHADRRIHELRLAPGGMARYRELAEVLRAHDHQLGAGLTDEERARLVMLLQRVAGAAGLGRDAGAGHLTP